MLKKITVLLKFNLITITSCEFGQQLKNVVLYKLLDTSRLNMSKSRLIIICGLPGSGKTTRAKALEAKLNAVRFCPDEWMSALSIDIYDEASREKIEKLQWELGRHLLKLGITIIIEWGTWGRSERDELRIGARAIGAAVELHYLSAPISILFERLQKRAMENPPITPETLKRWSKMFQVPTKEEMALFDPPA